MFNKIKKILGLIGMYLVCMPASYGALSLPNINVSMQNATTPQEFTQGVQVLIMLTILTLAPSIIIMTTAFIRIVIVLSLTRQAIGTASLPPNQVIVGGGGAYNKTLMKNLRSYLPKRIELKTHEDFGISNN